MDDSFNEVCTPPEIRQAVAEATKNLIPSKSKALYDSTYSNFTSWKERKKGNTSEKVLLAYFHELSKKYKPSSVWSFYSMLKCKCYCFLRL